MAKKSKKKFAKATADHQSKQVFVAYPYGLYNTRDYRKVYTAAERVYGIKFIFADEKITNMHILQKIISFIRSSDFSIFDISKWNPNVTLELGYAIASSDNWYILFNPEHTDLGEVPSDIRGIDRIQYNSFSGLEEKLTALLEQHYPKAERVSVDDYLASAQRDVESLLRTQPEMKVVEIADVLGMNKKMVQVSLRQMIEEGKVVSEGNTRGTRYSLT
jgi:hypothetical protein